MIINGEEYEKVKGKAALETVRMLAPSTIIIENMGHGQIRVSLEEEPEQYAYIKRGQEFSLEIERFRNVKVPAHYLTRASR